MKKTEKINILQIITNLELGGAQKQALFLIQKLDSVKYNKHFISAPQGLLLEEAQGMSDVHLCLLPALKRCISPLNDLKSFFFIINYIKKHNIHVVHTHSSKAGIIGRWAACLGGVKAVHTIHGWSFNDHQRMLLKQLYIFMERITARITTAFIAVSNNDIKKGLQHKIGREKQYKLIHYGVGVDINVSEGQKAHIKQKLGIAPGKVCVGMIACLKPQKNPLDFVRLASNICAKNPATIFLSVGDGILRGSMQQMIKEKKLEDRVKLCGWRKDIENILAVCDLIVLTSLWEGMPIALLEAMAFSKPVVAYASDGVKEMIKDGENGYLVKPKDIISLSKKVDLLLNDPEWAHQMGAKAREFFLQPVFRPEHMLKKTQELYEACLQG
ncbi:MAG: glycosyltransferase family 4 protein [Candidatus Omnitrophota bacterium]